MGWGKRGSLPGKPVTMGRVQGSKPSLGLSRGEGSEDQRMAGSRIWQCQQNLGSSSLTPIQWDHSQTGLLTEKALTQMDTYHFFSENYLCRKGRSWSEAEAKFSARAAVPHCTSLCPMAAASPAPAAGIPRCIQPHSHHPTALTTHTARSWIPCVGAARPLATTSPPTSVFNSENFNECMKWIFPFLRHSFRLDF